MLHFVLVSDSLDAGRSRDHSIHKGNDLYLVRALCLFLQKPRLLLRIITVFIGIGQQIIRLGMGLIEALIDGRTV